MTRRSRKPPANFGRLLLYSATNPTSGYQCSDSRSEYSAHSERWTLAFPTREQRRGGTTREVYSSPPLPPLAGDTPEPMQLGRARLTLEERTRRITSRSCLYCDSALAKRLRIPLVPLDETRTITALDGSPLGSGTITHATVPLTLSLSGAHQETIQLLLVSSPAIHVVLGYPWLYLHNPTVDWPTGTITSWGASCQETCLRTRLLPGSLPTDPAIDLSLVPSAYADIAPVFSKDLARILPPHRPYDCAIDLLPGTSPPRGRLYSLNRAETQAMEEYIRDCVSFSCGRRAMDSALALITGVSTPSRLRTGTKNTKADALSRQFDPPTVPKAPDPILPESIIVAPVRWGVEEAVRQALQGEPDPGTGPPNRLYVPTQVRTRVLLWGHASCLAGHPGVARTLEFVQRRFWWATIREDVKSFVSACSVCAQHKTSRAKQAGLLQPLPIPSRPWSHISLDFVTGLPPSRGQTVVLVVVDRFSKGCRFIPFAKLPSAPEMAEALVQHIIRVHGLPVDVVSDRGPQFTSRFWKAFCSLLGASVSLSSGFHPQSNGQTERTNQDLETTLRCFASANPASWSRHLPWAEYAYNSLVHSSLGMSPFECQFGFAPPLFPEQEAEVGVPSAEAFVRRCRGAWRRARRTLVRMGERHCLQANRRRRPWPSLRPGQRVWLSAKDLPLRVESRKLAPRFVGPFKIVRRITPVSYRLQLPSNMRVHPTFHVSQLKPVLISLPLLLLLSLGSSTGCRPTQSTVSSTLVGVDVGFSSLWIGRGTVRRNEAGSLRGTFWTPPLSGTSTLASLPSLVVPSGVVPKGGGTVTPGIIPDFRH
ncbi:uncharacterized protein FYW47_007740 [Aplochiton taeniatus]